MERTVDPELVAWVSERASALGLELPAVPDLPSRALVGFDGAKGALEATRWSAKLADEVHLGICTGTRALLADGRRTRHQHRSRAQDLRYHARQGRHAIEDELGLHVQVHEQDDDEVDGLQHIAREIGAGLLAVGASSSIAPLSEQHLGSVAETLVNEAATPTLLARTPASNGPVLVAMGEDPASGTAAAWGLAVASWLDTALVLVHASVEQNGPPGFAASRPGARAHVAPWPARRGLSQAIQEQAPTLLVMGHGRGPGWLGSTALALVRSLPITTLIVR